MMDVRTALDELFNRLRDLTDTPELDAYVLLAHVTGRSRSWLVSHPETPLTPPEVDSVRRSAADLEAGTPLPYVLGHWEFFGLEFDLTPNVLIPRPETELLVERAIIWLQSLPVTRFSSLRAVDVGTGSGCIAVSLAANLPDLRVTATDLSHAALEVAKRNAIKHNVAHRIDFLQCDLLPPHPDPLPTESHFDLICANLPYIPSDTLHGLPIFGREPSLALDGGSDGLDPIRRLLQVAPEWLAPHGMILLETEATLGLPTLSLAYDAFANATIHLHQDLSGNDRLVEIMVA
jgi:release factor glutamine methyltransferase